jgi:hypothetical protein
VISKFFASWDAQTIQKLWPSKSLASNYFQTSGRKSLCKSRPSLQLQHQPAVALFMAVLGLNGQCDTSSFFIGLIKTSDLTQKNIWPVGSPKPGLFLTGPFLGVLPVWLVASPGLVAQKP